MHNLTTQASLHTNVTVGVSEHLRSGKRFSKSLVSVPKPAFKLSGAAMDTSVESISRDTDKQFN